MGQLINGQIGERVSARRFEAVGLAASALLNFFFGAAAAIGLEIDSIEASWPSEDDLSTILELRAPVPGTTAIGSLQVQLWLGLREMARLRDDTVAVPSKNGDAILSLWRAALRDEVSQSWPRDVQITNGSVIAWLEHCRENGWRLVNNRATA